MKSVKKNFLYNVIYQVLILFIPFITAPYVSRVLGVTGVGNYSYTYSIVSYFMLFVLLGLNNYGNRIIAKSRDDKIKRSKIFWELYLLQFFIGLIMISLYIIFIIAFSKDKLMLFIIESGFLISSVFDINWFFFGMEEFKKTVIRNMIIKILTVVLIFLFVKKSDDLYLYVGIMSTMTLLSQLALWPFLFKYISPQKISFNDIIKHIKPNIILFIPFVAVSFYKVMDKIMIGFLSSLNDVGYYENAEKIINIPISFINALGTVMLPRISNLTLKGKINEIQNYLKKSIEFIMFISYPMMFGLMAISFKFAPIFFGNEFSESGFLIFILSLSIPFIAYANVIRTQYLIPNEKEKIFVSSVIGGAIINIILNIIFIRLYGAKGACISTVISEVFVMAYQAYKIRKVINTRNYIVNTTLFLIKSIIMYIVIFLLNFCIKNDIILIIVQILFGVLIYALLNYKYIFTIIRGENKNA